MIVVQTAAATEPLTLDEAKLFIRDDGNNSQDDVIEMLISDVRAQAEQQLGRYLITQTLDLYLDSFPCYSRDRRPDADRILLPPIQSVTSITYVDYAGVTQTLAADQYLVDANSKPARIGPAYGLVWPPTREQDAAVKVRFVAGYGTAAQVPPCIKNWMLLRIKTAFDNRDALASGSMGSVQMPGSYVDGLLDPERAQGFR